MDADNKYTKMQQTIYDNHAAGWSVENRDPVVGSFDAHNAWTDYDTYLFKGVETNGKIALDFACGPGRNMVRFADRFSRIDGVDISETNIINAKKWLQKSAAKVETRLYKNNGVDLCNLPTEYYDVVFSTIAMQHICVHEIRYNYFKEFYRVLKKDGSVCVQMGFGPSHKHSVGYYVNHYDATDTNGYSDTRIESVDQIRGDLESIGYTNFSHDIRPTGPGDTHDNWIFFRATK